MDNFNPYAAPQTQSVPPKNELSTITPYWRSGRRLVVAPDAVLNNRCVKCNQQVGVRPRKFKLSWHSPWVFLVLLIGPLPYVVVALLMQKKLTVTVGVCRAHARRRRLAIVAGWLLFLAGVAGLFLLPVPALRGLEVVVTLSAILVMVTGALVGVLALRIIWPRKITKEFGWLDGAGAEYLADLPEFSGPR